jgi:DNA-binding response OmpR family regulator
MQKLIYIADDEENIRDLIKSYLEREGYEVIAFPDGESLLAAFQSKEPDMIVLDIMMPGINGLDVCREIRKVSEVPLILVSARDDTFDKVLGLELGSDDYLAKPFSPRELVARMKTVFRRVRDYSSDSIRESDEKSTIHVQDILIKPSQRSVFKDGKEIEFTTKEFDLMLFLANHKNVVFNREQILNAVWGTDFYGDSRAVDDLIKRIRKKLSNAGSTLEIATVWGYGYKLTV